MKCVSSTVRRPRDPFHLEKTLRFTRCPSFPDRRRDQGGAAVQQVRLVLRRTDRLPHVRQTALPPSHPPAARAAGLARLPPRIPGHLPVFALTELKGFSSNVCYFVFGFLLLAKETQLFTVSI